MVLVAKFESRRGIWTVKSPTLTGNDQEFSFLQEGWNLGDGEEILLIETNKSFCLGLGFNFNFIPSLH